MTSLLVRNAPDKSVFETYSAQTAIYLHGFASAMTDFTKQCAEYLEKESLCRGL